MLYIELFPSCYFYFFIFEIQDCNMQLFWKSRWFASIHSLAGMSKLGHYTCNMFCCRETGCQAGADTVLDNNYLWWASLRMISDQYRKSKKGRGALGETQRKVWKKNCTARFEPATTAPSQEAIILIVADFAQLLPPVTVSFWFWRYSCKFKFGSVAFLSKVSDQLRQSRCVNLPVQTHIFPLSHYLLLPNFCGFSQVVFLEVFMLGSCTLIGGEIVYTCRRSTMYVVASWRRSNGWHGHPCMLCAVQNHRPHVQHHCCLTGIKFVQWSMKET